MTELYVDPDGLTAVAEVARRQGDHVERVSSYISSTCSQFGAFSGVLNIFEGSYRSAVTSALDGMRDGGTIATKVQETVTDCRQTYLDADREAYEEMKGLYGDMSGFPPYQPPGSGRSTPGGPYGAPPAPGESPDDDGKFELPTPPPWVDGPLGRVLPDADDSTPPWLDPKNMAKDAIVDEIRQQIKEDRYLDYRAQGMTPAEATAAATRDADDIAREHVEQTSRQRVDDAYTRAHDDAYNDAINNGKTPDEARDAALDAGRDAATERHHEDTADRQKRDDIGDAGGAYKGLYDGVNDAIGGAQDLKDNIDQLNETGNDLDDYHDYQGGSGSNDRSAQDWGTR